MVNTVRSLMKQDIRSKYEALLNGPPAPAPHSGASSSEYHAVAEAMPSLRGLKNWLNFRDPKSPEHKVTEMVYGCKLTQSRTARQVKDLIARDPRAYAGTGRKEVEDLADKVIEYRSGYQKLASYRVGVIASAPGAIVGALGGFAVGIAAAPIRGIVETFRSGTPLRGMGDAIVTAVALGASLGGAVTSAMTLPVTVPMHLNEHCRGKASEDEGFAPRRAVADVLSIGC